MKTDNDILQAQVIELQAENQALLQSLEELADHAQKTEPEEYRKSRLARTGNSLILNLEALNNDTGGFFAELEHYHPSTQRSVLRLLKQHHDLLVNQFQLHNLHL